MDGELGAPVTHRNEIRDLLERAREVRGLGDLVTAEDLFRRALMAARESGDGPGEVVALLQLGGVALDAEDPGGARAFYSDGLLRGRALGDSLAEADALAGLGRVATAVGDSDEADQRFVAAADAYAAAGDAGGEARARLALGRLRQDRSAVDQCDRAVDLFVQVGDRAGEGQALLALGASALATGRLTTAHGAFSAAAELFDDLGDDAARSEAEAGLARVESWPS